MHGFPIADGFVEVSECIADVIKHVANEPAVGLYYIQQHVQNAVPKIMNLNDELASRSQETHLQTADMEDAITTVKSMKENGLCIADDMIKDTEQSLAVLSRRQQLIRRRPPGHPEDKSERVNFASLIKNAKRRASGYRLLPLAHPIEQSSSFISTDDDDDDDELPLSSYGDSEVSGEVFSHEVLLENYNHFKVNKEAQLQEWLDGARVDRV